MLHSVSFMREQAASFVDKHRGDGLAPMMLELCDEVDDLRARLAHALLYVSDDDQALATSLPTQPADDQPDLDESLTDDEKTAVRKASDEDA